MRISDWSSDVCSSDLLFALRVGTIRAGATFEPVSREGALVINNLLLSVILAIVLIGTLYPIVAASMGVQLSVGAPFFDKNAGPIALALVAVMAAGPLIGWRRDRARDRKSTRLHSSH